MAESYPPTLMRIVDAFEQAVASLDPSARPGDEYLSTLGGDEAYVYNKIDIAERRIDRLIRDALAYGELTPLVRSGQQFEILSDREAWCVEALIPGFQAKTHHLLNPGPVDDREVFIERKAFEKWLQSQTVIDRSPQSECSDDDARAVIRRAMEENSGFIAQNVGADIVRKELPGFQKKRAMALVKELTENEKPGPRGPRRKSCG